MGARAGDQEEAPAVEQEQRLRRGQVAERVDRRRALADLEVQLRPLGVRRAELGDLLPARHLLLLLYHDFLVVRVDGDEAVLVLDHDQLAQARNAAADIGDAAGGRGDDRIAELAVDVDSLAARLGEAGDHLTLGRPDELDRVGVLRLVFRYRGGSFPRVAKALRLWVDLGAP